ncbi:MAG: sugar phosphate nucleotidyltransferase [Candidatus Binataceae bacterium]
MTVVNRQERAAIILAGGEGTRLKRLVRSMTGQDVPKQYCTLLGEETLIGRTRRRVEMAVDPEHTVFVVNQGHEQYYSSILSGVSKSNLVVQPDTRGTAPAILLALMRVAATQPDASVAIFPSDQFVSDEREFVRHVEIAFEVANDRPELVVVLGVEPSHPDVSYGWIEPAERIDLDRCRLYRVGALWEKPTVEDAVWLLKRGCLWNSSVVIGRVSTIVGMIMVATPELHSAFAPLRTKFPEPPSPRQVAAVYKDLPVTSFSQHVLRASPANLAVLPVAGVRWIDLEEPQRLQQTWNQLGLKPLWTVGSHR